jgi:hypothetical protein
MINVELVHFQGDSSRPEQQAVHGDMDDVDEEAMWEMIQKQQRQNEEEAARLLDQSSSIPPQMTPEQVNSYIEMHVIALGD